KSSGERDPRPISAMLEFRISSPTRPFVTVPINGSVPAHVSCLVVAPEELDFGTVRMGCESNTRSFLLYNTCSQDVLITDFRLADPAGQPAGGPDCSGPQPCPEFTLMRSVAIPTGGLRLQSGQAPVEFQVKYRPIDAGADMGSVEIDVTTGAMQSTLATTFRGTGDASNLWQTDVFLQGTPPRLDLLFVIDDSPSMAAHQSSVASNLGEFLQYLVTRDLDFNIAVITADPAEGGIFRSGPTHPEAVLSALTPDLEAKFAAKIDVGTSGTGTPQCLAQALAALTPPVIGSQNAGFLRAEAGLSVICVTDSSDHSPLPVSDYVNAFRSIKVPLGTSAFRFSAVGGFSPSCPGDTGALADAIAQSGGDQANICDSDWHASLESWGTLAFGPRSNFFLTSVPDLTRGAIEVRIDQQLVAPTSTRGDSVWTFDAISNAIIFAPMHVPPPGSTIEVRYITRCYG
ncbi:MAG: hypothetical protein WBV82_28140, partial [Myxococcaceae bacterium]